MPEDKEAVRKELHDRIDAALMKSRSARDNAGTPQDASAMSQLERIENFRNQSSNGHRPV
jgi:hypothetical protein